MLTFNHLAVYVTEMRRSEHFYGEVLGLEQIPEPFHDGLHTWYRIGAGGALHVIGEAKAASEHDITNHLAFQTDRLDELMERLDAAGVVYRNFRGDAKVNRRPDGVRQIFFQDPDGYWVEVNDAKD